MSRRLPRTFRTDASHIIDSRTGLPLASFTARAAAFFIDFLLVVLCIAAVRIPMIIHETPPDANATVRIDPFHGWEFVPLAAYFALVTYFGRGQTLGKRLTRIRVVSLVHEHLSFWHSVERAIGYGASVLEGGFGFLQFFFDPNHQTVHDRIAHTIVINTRKPGARRGE